MKRILKKLQSPWTVIAILASLLLPIIFATLLVGIGNLLGCQMAGSSTQMCYLAGLNIGQTIIMFVDLTLWAVAFGIIYLPQVSIGLLAGLLILLHFCCSKKSLMSLRLGSIWYVSMAPAIASFVFVLFVGNAAQCRLDAGGTSDCYLFGVNTGDTFYVAGMMPLVIFLLVPLCSILTAIYYALIRQSRKHKKKLR